MEIFYLSTSLKVDPMSDSTGLSNLEGFYPKAYKETPKQTKHTSLYTFCAHALGIT